MIKNILLLSFLTCSLCCYGQTIHLIPQVGLNVNTYDFDETSSNQSNQRFSAGVTAGLGFNIGLDDSRDFILQPELNYSMRNNRVDQILGVTETSNANLRQKTMLHYLEVPLLARFNFGIDTRYYFNIGPSFSYALGGKEKLESNEPRIESYNRSADFDLRFNRTDWSAVIGGGVELPTSDSFITLDARFAWGFKNLYKARDIERIGDDGNVSTIAVGPEGKNRIFTLSIGYAIPLN